MKKRIFIIPILLLIWVVGCAHAPVQLTPKQRATLYMETYRAQYYDYMFIVGYVKQDDEWVKTHDPVFNEEQRNTLRKKKDLLTEVYPLIMMYNSIIDLGSAPDADLERRIIDIINSIIY